MAQLEKRALKWILLTFGGTAIILTISLVIDYSKILGTNQTYSVTFDGKPFFSDEGVTSLLYIYNMSQYANIYGVPNSSLVTLTDLVSDSGIKIQMNNKTFEILSHGKVFNSNDSITIRFFINNSGPGAFNGYILLGGKETSLISIPMTASTSPLIAESIILIIIGVTISVCLWELIIYERNLRKKKTKQPLKEKAAAKKEESMKANRRASKCLARMEEIKNLQNQNLLGLHEFTMRKEALTPIMEHSTQQAAINESESSALELKIAEAEKDLLKYNERNESAPKSAGRIALIEVAPSFFAIFIAMFAVLGDQSTLSAVLFSPLAVAKLVGLGLATGSLKELVDK